LYLVLAHFKAQSPVKIVAPQQKEWESNPFPNAMFLSPSKPDVDSLSFNDLGPLSYEWGWIYILPGLIDDKNNNLYLTSVTFKSADENAQHLFQRVKKIVKKGLRFGVRVTSPNDDGGRISREYEYSSEAERLYKEDGIHWRQRGVGNSRFAPAASPGVSA